VTISSRPEAEGRIVKQPFKDRVQQASYDFLSNAIPDGGDTKRTEALAFWNEVATQWEGLKRAILEVAFQGREILGQVSLKHLDADPVDARRTAIAFDRLEGGVQKRCGDPPSEGVCLYLSNRKQGHADFSLTFTNRHDFRLRL
jgi:hypothetical protein